MSEPRANQKKAEAILDLLLRIDTLEFKARYDLMKALENILIEWVELSDLTEEFCSPSEAPPANE